MLPCDRALAAVPLLVRSRATAFLAELPLVVGGKLASVLGISKSENPHHEGECTSCELGELIRSRQAIRTCGAGGVIRRLGRHRAITYRLELRRWQT